ncbi:MAG: hypothetical protein QNI93_11820 [Kiloniellales bacterium]|nr:hypothetical protein [Kiloniellales bacterium]
MPTRLQAFLAQQRSRGMSDQAIRRALGLSRQEAAEAELFGSKETVGRPAVRGRKPSTVPGRRP